MLIDKSWKLSDIFFYHFEEQLVLEEFYFFMGHYNVSLCTSPILVLCVQYTYYTHYNVNSLCLGAYGF